MASILQLIYVSRKLTTGAGAAGCEPLTGEPAIARLARRLAAGYAAPIRILCHEEETAARLREACGELAVLAVPALHRFEALLQLVGQADAQTLLIYPESTVFPDCAGARRMLDAHLRDRPDATFAEDYPPGLLPEIVETAAIRRLATHHVGPNEAGCLLAAMQRVNRQANDGRPAFRFLEFPRGAEWNRLPASLLLSTGNARRAAELTLEESAGDPALDAAPALRYAEILHALDSRPEVAAPASARRRILFATLADLYAGAEESFFLLISRLDRARYEPIVLLPEGGLLARKLADCGVEVRFPAIDPSRVNPASLHWFEEFLRAFCPSLVHIDSFAFPSLVLPAWLAGIPIVHHIRVLHGRNSPETFKFASRAVAISDSVRLDLLRNGIPPEAIVTIPNGLDLARFTPRPGEKTRLRAEHEIPSGAFVLAMAARISADKRQHFVVNALPEIARRIPNVLLLLAGETYEWQIGYRQELDAAISRLHLERRVRFIGFEPDGQRIAGRGHAAAGGDREGDGSRAAPLGGVEGGSGVGGKAGGGERPRRSRRRCRGYRPAWH